MFYQDEVDIHLNPKIGADSGYREKQRKVDTLGQNKNIFWPERSLARLAKSVMV